MKKFPLYLQILLGMAAGVLFAFVLIQFSFGVSFIKDWIKPFGNIFISLLKLIAIPLILASLVKGVSDLKDISQLSTMGIRTLILFLVTTVLSVSLGLAVVNIIKPGKSISEVTRTEMLAAYGGEAANKKALAQEQKQSGPLSFLEDMVPDNIVSAASSNAKMLQVIFFALFLGIALVSLPEKSSQPLKSFFDSLNDAVLKMIDIIMRGAPFGVFALMASLVAESPGLELFKALGWYALTVLIGLGLLIFGVYPALMALYAKRKPGTFLKQIGPAQLLGFSTSSSAATLPLTMEITEKEVGVENDVASFVLPIGATINMDGTSLYQAVAAVFIAQAFGMDLTLGQQLGIILTATLASIGSAAVPGAGMVMLVIVLAQAGIPEAGLALIFAVDRPLDMVRTTTNVTSNITVCSIVAKSLGKLRNTAEANTA
jgi:Na+/H+-dicarboxylate symporter